MGFSQRLRQARTAAGLTQSDVATAAGVSPQAVSGWERGESVPEMEKLRVIARGVHSSVSWLLEDEGGGLEGGDLADGPTVPLKGYVRAGAHAQYLPLNDDELDRVEAPAGSTSRTVALEIRGDSLGELFDRWLVFFDDVRSPVTPDLLGKLCVVWVNDGRVLIKKVKKQRNGLFALYSNYEKQDPPIEDVQLDGAARVKAMVPR